MTTRRIVLDANILIRAVLGRRVRDLVERYGEGAAFFAPDVVFDEAARHLPTIAGRRGQDAAGVLDVLEELRTVIHVVASEVIAPMEQTAMVRIGARDPMDWPVVAAALVLDCPIWTEDRDFFGVGVPTWTSSLVEVYLSDG